MTTLALDPPVDLAPEVGDDLTRRELIVGSLAAGLLLAACGDGDTSGTTPTPETRDERRVIEHVFGTTTLPRVPERIVTLDIAHLGHLLPLGVAPVGSVEFGGKVISPAFASAARAVAGSERIASVGKFGEPNLEAIAALRPDLILMFGLKERNEDLYQKLSQLAPTVATSLGHTDWQAVLRLVATALGEGERGQELLAGYERRVADLRSKLGGSLERLEFTIVNSGPDRFFVYTDGTWINLVANEVGLRISAAQQAQLDGIGEISLEQVSLLDTDVILNMVQDRATLDQPQLVETVRAERNPLWTRLRAVGAGQVYDVDATLWTGGRSLLGAHLVLDDLFRILPRVKELPDG